MASTPAMASLKFVRPTLPICLVLLFLSLFSLNLASARLGKSCHGFHTAFFFPDFSSGVQRLTLSGDAKVVGSALQISSSASSAGSAFYPQSVRLSNPFRKGESRSFSSFFSFSMDSNKGSGIAFVIAPSKEFSGKIGPWLGLSDQPSDLAHTVAIEFDTSMDAEVNDPSGNHVGFDLESLVSLATAEVSDGFSLKDGEKLYAWIDYIAPLKTLEVRLSRSVRERPASPILSHNIDLSNVWQEEMFVGFSSSTGDAPQSHVIYSWSFITRDAGMWRDFPRYHPGSFGPHNRDGEHGPRDWHHGPHDWHHGPHDWHNGPRDRHHGPRDFHHGPGDWHHEGYPYIPNDWHHEHFHFQPGHIDNDETWFDGLSDVWGVLLSLLFGAACGTLAAGVILGVWFLIRKCLMRGVCGGKHDGGILFGYQKLTTPVSDEKVNANGYQKLSTMEPEGKPEDTA